MRCKHTWQAVSIWCIIAMLLYGIFVCVVFEVYYQQEELANKDLYRGEGLRETEEWLNLDPDIKTDLRVLKDLRYNTYNMDDETRLWWIHHLNDVLDWDRLQDVDWDVLDIPLREYGPWELRLTPEQIATPGLEEYTREEATWYYVKPEWPIPTALLGLIAVVTTLVLFWAQLCESSQMTRNDEHISSAWELSSRGESISTQPGLRDAIDNGLFNPGNGIPKPPPKEDSDYARAREAVSEERYLAWKIAERRQSNSDSTDLDSRSISYTEETPSSTLSSYTSSERSHTSSRSCSILSSESAPRCCEMPQPPSISSSPESRPEKGAALVRLPTLSPSPFDNKPSNPRRLLGSTQSRALTAGGILIVVVGLTLARRRLRTRNQRIPLWN